MKRITKIALFLMMAAFIFAFSPVRADAAVNSKAEQAIVNGVKGFKTQISIESYKVKKTSLPELWNSVFYNHSEIFYLSSTYTYTLKNDIVVSIKPKYTYKKTDVTAMQKKLDSAASKITKKVTSSMSQAEKAMVVFDYLALNTSYDDDAKTINTTCYGPLVNGKGTCFGYANAFNYIMKNKLGFESYVNVATNKKHSWNTIKIDGAYYNCDVTWADPYKDLLGNVWHSYFLVSDNTLSKLFEGAYKGSCAKKATSTKFEKFFFNSKVTSEIARVGSKWYFVDSNSNLCEGNMKTGKKTVLVSLKSKIGNITSGSNGSYCKLAVVAGKLYVNNSKAIYKVNINGTKTTFSKISGVSCPSNKKIYGIANINGVLKYHVKSSAFGDVGSIKATSIKG